MQLKEDSKRAQLTIFIIIAILIIALVAGFFLLKDYIKIGDKLPASIEPVHNYFLSCLEDDVLVGIDILESQAGYIFLPDFEPGSSYMPFSNQLDFLGNPVPYWYYVSGNNIQKEQVPSKNKMQEQLKDFIELKINDCNFENYYEQGFVILQGEPEAKVDIRGNEVEVNLDMNLNIEKGEDSALIKDHRVIVKSKLGTLYDLAKEVYDKEQDELFLEKYAVDTLRLYAPVDGVELSCSPKTWVANDVFEELRFAIEANTLALKTKGGDFNLNKEENKYFVIDLDVGAEVRFMNSRNWPYSFEVDPSEGNVLIAAPVGNQPGLGALGFCYIPYHFVYSVKYPVLIQIQIADTPKGTSEIFQFPVAVVLQNNNPRESLDTEAVEIGLPELCEHKNTLVKVNTYDINQNNVDADISYECFGTNCDIGKTENGFLEEEFPQCVNGFILARAEGYKDTKYLYSTTQEGSVDVVLDKLYELEVDLNLNNIDYDGEAIISFISDDSSSTVVYPEQKIVELSEGQYEVQVYIYKNSSLKLKATTTQQCVEVPQQGIGGFFGVTKEKCFDIKIPEQIISNALAGGGKQNYYILEDELIDSEFIEINAGGLPTPTTLEKLQDNYLLFEEKKLGINFK